MPAPVMRALAAGRRVITGRTPAITSPLRDGVECATVPVGDGHALAAELQRLANVPEELCALAAAGREAYLREFSIRGVGDRLRAVCAALAPAGVSAASASISGELSASVVTASGSLTCKNVWTC